MFISTFRRSQQPPCFPLLHSFAILAGPVAHLKHITSKERLPFTAAWLGSLGLTLFFAIGRKAYLATLICAIVQLVALVSYLFAYFP